MTTQNPDPDRIDDVQPYGSDLPPDDRRRALRSGGVPIAVHGLGKMGLPLAAAYAELTGNVVGVDVDPAVVDAVNRGESPIEREPGLPELVSEMVAAGALRATDDPVAAAESARVHVVLVPTVLREGGDPDLSNLEAAIEAIGAGLAPGDLVIVESTLPPGTCTDLVEPLLVDVSGLDPGEFGLAFCPERTSSGRALEDIRGAYPKVVGGVDDESTRAAELIYGELTDNDVIPVSDATTAECVKVFEGIYRDVNIALANELARFTDELGVDVNEAIDTANTQPFCDIHTPGPGVGGHCIPYYPYFLISGRETEAPLTRTAREVNDSMPAFTVEKLVEGLRDAGVAPEEATVLLLGLTYRPGIAEIRKSPARPIASLLDELGATVLGVDPVLDSTEEFAVDPVGIEEIPDADADAAVMVTPHAEFDAIDWTALDPMVVVDGRQTLDLDGTDHAVYTIGSGPGGV